MSRRTERVASTIQQELAVIIMRELNDPRITGMPSITRVKVSPDLSVADVYMTIMGTAGQQNAALNALRHSAGLMRTKLTAAMELRVATDLEIQELLGVRYPQIEKRVAMITQALNNIFEREHTMNLERMKTISRRDARQFLRELPEIHPYVEAYVMLFAFDGHCI